MVTLGSVPERIFPSCFSAHFFYLLNQNFQSVLKNLSKQLEFSVTSDNF